MVDLKTKVMALCENAEALGDHRILVPKDLLLALIREKPDVDVLPSRGSITAPTWRLLSHHESIDMAGGVQIEIGYSGAYNHFKLRVRDRTIADREEKISMTFDDARAAALKWAREHLSQAMSALERALEPTEGT